MKRRVIALLLLLAIASVPAAEACQSYDCCISIYQAKIRGCYRAYLAAVVPTCLAAVSACGCTLAPVVAPACAAACAGATTACITTIVLANAAYADCALIAQLERDGCIDGLVADCT